MDATDGGFTAVARTLDVGDYLTQSQVEGYLCAVGSSLLCSVRSVLLRTTESHLTSGRPRNGLTFAVCQSNNDIVKRRVNMKLSLCANLDISLLCRSCFLCHSRLLFSSFFLVCNCLFLTLARTSVVFCALTTYGKSETMTDAAIAADVHETLDVELYFGAEVTLDLVVFTNDFTNLTSLFVGPVLYFNVFVNTGLCQNLTGAAASNTKNVG